MESSNCWRDLFLEAYRYSTKYLIFTITTVIASIFFLWLYEKPRFYKLIFKMSKHSNNVSRVESEMTLTDETRPKENFEMTQEIHQSNAVLRQNSADSNGAKREDEPLKTRW